MVLEVKSDYGPTGGDTATGGGGGGGGGKAANPFDAMFEEFEDEEEVGDYIISKCTESGGRQDENKPLFTEGKYYIDQDQDMEFDTLESAREKAESMSEE